MPFSTSQNPGMAQAANTFARIFVGDPTADAAYRKQSIEGETEYQKQKLLQQQAITEGAQRKAYEAAAMQSQAAAGKYAAETARQKEENDSYKHLGTIITGIPAAAAAGAWGDPSVNAVRDQVTSAPDFRPTPAAAAPIDNAIAAATPAHTSQALDAQMPAILGALFTGGMKPEQLTALAALPGATDEQRARFQVAGGKPLGQNDYVSLDDRNNNRRFEVSAGARLTGGDGTEYTPLAPVFTANMEAETRAHDAQAAKGNGRGGKVPKFSNSDVTASLGMLAKSLGIKPEQFDGSMSYNIPMMKAIAQNPQVAQDLMDLSARLWQESGGNAARVNQGLMAYMHGISNNNAPLTDFRQVPATAQLPQIQQILAGMGISDEAPAGGAPAPVPLGNVMTGGAAPGASGAGSPNDGITATGPNGEKLVLRNGQWVAR